MKICLVEKDHLPNGAKCTLCGRIARPGQFVLWQSIPDVMHIVFHTGCLHEKLEEIPEDLDTTLEVAYTAIRQDYIEGRVFNDNE